MDIVINGIITILRYLDLYVCNLLITKSLGNLRMICKVIYCSNYDLSFVSRESITYNEFRIIERSNIDNERAINRNISYSRLMDYLMIKRITIPLYVIEYRCYIDWNCKRKSKHKQILLPEQYVYLLKPFDNPEHTIGPYLCYLSDDEIKQIYYMAYDGALNNKVNIIDIDNYVTTFNVYIDRVKILESIIPEIERSIEKYNISNDKIRSWLSSIKCNCSACRLSFVNI